MGPDPTTPLLRRFPGLERLPRASLGRFPTPVQEMRALAPGLWFKREDLTADPLGGNKVRALEFLLGDVRSGQRVVTVGAAGSTHVLATVVYARQLGARPVVYRWRQEMNDAARLVSERIGRESGSRRVERGVLGAYVRAFAARLRGAHWVPAGGSTPLGVLGQVNAALELSEQVEDRLVPRPDRVVVPLGTGGTVAGLALGFAIANLETEVIGVRVVPRVVANLARVQRLMARTFHLIERLTPAPVPRPRPTVIRIAHDFYGGAYGRSTTEGNDASTRCAAHTGLAIDPTYGAKALAAALAEHEKRGGTTLFWLSFDARWLQGDRNVGTSPDVVALT
jgi:D-cysteine desulfhydrase